MVYREAIEKEQARQRYEKLHAEGKTDEARADLARLAIVKKQREEAAKKKDQDKKGLIYLKLYTLFKATIYFEAFLLFFVCFQSCTLDNAFGFIFLL